MSQHSEFIGFVGLGNMDGAMCDRLVKAGYSVSVYDVRSDKLVE
ncbi:MAG TPA: NAD(P)-dependent oxidoreductase [Acidimicrobiia bacterium]|jgi:3-hydroxyisobutyrate dehydrogenase-like beta-hydroxyacid dehydrogenase|nr:NAD(P)-dependent oxidoreductase [Acidimicrobiia bacterium]